MFNSRSLRSAVIVAVVAMLAAGCGRAPENEGDGPTMKFVRIPAGSFYMGSPSSEKDRDNNEGPVHEVRITEPFYMGKYEVTQAQWKAVMGTTVAQQHEKASWPLLLKGDGSEYPIYYVSWEEASEFCKRLGGKFHLPTEAEWEYACRAGSQTRFYYGDDPNYSELNLYAWYEDNSNERIRPVGRKKPNAWDLYDMYGNLSEWCSDRYAAGLNNYENAGSVDPTGPTSGYMFRVRRGGSWIEEPASCRSAHRNAGGARGGGTEFIGFRVVFAGKVRGGKEVLEIALPEEVAEVVTVLEQERKIQPDGRLIIAGAVRDEAGMPIDGVQMEILPSRDWFFREYAESRFEASWRPPSPGARMQGCHFVARHTQRNLAMGMEIKEDANALDVKLEPGVILTGEVVDGNGKGIEDATVAIKLQTSNWSGDYLSWVKSDAEGRFEFRALPPGYEYVLLARKIHYLVGQTEVRSESVRHNHIDGISIALPRGKFSVSGVVVDAKGKPVSNAWVYCTGKGQAGINSHTDKDGRFKADGIFEGKVDIIASIQGSDGRALGGSISVEAGATNLRIVLGKNAAPPPKGRACFPAETDVWVNGSVVKISEVARGQTVGKHGCAVPAAAFGQIENIEEHTGKFECRDIMLENGNRISVVYAHCFMLDSGRWIAAHDLRSGMRLKTLNGIVSIKSVTTKATPFVGKVYNLKIKSSDRYMVGKDGVIVRDY